MHAEWGDVDAETADALNAARAAGGRIVAVGTTSLRLLESAADEDGVIRPFAGETAHLHHARLPLPRRRRADDQLPPAALDAVHAGRRLLRPRHHAARLRARDRRRLPLLFLRRRLPAVSARRAGATDERTGFSFRLLRDRRRGARCGEIATPHGIVRTPAFMPVGTQATVKALHPDQVRATGADIVLGNTYHLMLRPGAERIAALGGLHRFMQLAASDPDRFRRLPGHVAGEAAQDRRARRHLPLASRRRDASRSRPSARSRSRPARLRHRDAARRMHARCRPREPRSRRAMRLSLRWAERCKRAFEARRRRPRAVRHRAGRRRRGAAGRERARAGRHRLRRLRASAGSRSASRRR